MSSERFKNAEGDNLDNGMTTCCFTGTSNFSLNFNFFLSDRHFGYYRNDSFQRNVVILHAWASKCIIYLQMLMNGDFERQGISAFTGRLILAPLKLVRFWLPEEWAIYSKRICDHHSWLNGITRFRKGISVWSKHNIYREVKFQPASDPCKFLYLMEQAAPFERYVKLLFIQFDSEIVVDFDFVWSHPIKAIKIVLSILASSGILSLIIVLLVYFYLHHHTSRPESIPCDQ